MVRIDLNDYRSPGVRTFSGRERGAQVRLAAELNTLDRDRRSVEIYVPEDVFSVSSSFLLGLLSISIRSLGEREFRRRYRFTGKDISRSLNDAIRIALRV